MFCYRVCPLIDKAITLEKQHNPRSDKHALFIQQYILMLVPDVENVSKLVY